MVQDRERAFQAFHDVHVLHGRLVHVRVFLDGEDQVGNARRAAFDFVKQTVDLGDRRDSDERRAGRAGIELRKERFEHIRLDVAVRQAGRKLPQIVLPVAAQQRIQLLLEVGHGQGVRRGILVLDDAGLQLLDFRFLRRGEVAPAEFVGGVANFLQDVAQLAGGALGGGGGIVEFVSEAGGKFSERGQAVALLFPARRLANAVGHHADEALGQLGHFLHEFVKFRFGKSQDAAVGQRAGAERERFHSGKGQPPGHLAGIDSNDHRLAGEFAARLELAFEKDKHRVGRIARGSSECRPP